jgi:hypothetical protein
MPVSALKVTAEFGIVFPGVKAVIKGTLQTSFFW